MADITITAANVLTISGRTKPGTAGEAITAGEALYRKRSDGKLYKADCDAADPDKAQVVGIAANSASTDQAVDYYWSGDIYIGGTTAVGTVYVLSGTAGGICPVSDMASADYSTVIGIGLASNALRIGINCSRSLVP